jgi:hypothetical protein
MEFDPTWWERFEDRERPNLPWPEWRGERLEGKRLVVWPEQGLGDKIMFSRCLPLLKGFDVTVLCEPALVRLFRQNFSVDVVEASGQTEFPDPNFWVMYGSLPLRVGALPSAPYLSVPPRSLGGIGVCAQGSPRHPNDANRSLFGEDAARLLSLPGAVDLSPEASGATDFADTAEIIAGLDLVITVDTSVAHLAGALGKPVWILLPSEGLDWRWGQIGASTAWYPSATLYRQGAEPWSSVLDRVIMDAQT